MLNDKRTINAWALFDWANSSYSLVITVAIFPVYYLAATTEIINVGGIEMYNSTLYAYAISMAYLIIAMFSPLLSGIADYSGRKKFFLRFFTTLGSLSCISLFFFTGMTEEATVAQNNLQLAIGTIAFILATIGWAGSLVFYNAYLPEIVTEDRYDSVSAKGYSYGYVGSILLLISNLVIIQKPEWFGISDPNLAVRISFVLVGLWWFGFAQLSFSRLPEDVRKKTSENLLTKGFKELQAVWKAVGPQKHLKTFLLAFFSYSVGVQTVLFLAATFAEKQMQFGSAELIVVILLLNLLGIFGAYAFAKLSEAKGNKLSLLVTLSIWTLICIAGYFVSTKAHFYGIAMSVGLVMGGIQSLSRSTYTKLIPENTKDITSYFSFYDVLEKVAIVLGTFTFGFVGQITGGMHNSLLALAVFFIFGLIILFRVKIQAQD